MKRKEEILNKAIEFVDKNYMDVGIKTTHEASVAACQEIAEWADEHHRKGLVDIDKVCEWMKTNYTEFLDSSRLGINIEELVEDLRNDFKTK